MVFLMAKSFVAFILYESSYCQRDVNQGAPAWFASPTCYSADPDKKLISALLAA